jgi:predicted nuclease of predicted toxin-antitoxin system
VKLLIDNALSPVVASLLRDAGHDALHVRDLGLAAAEDDALVARAANDGRVVVSADTDFGTILALRVLRSPSFILWRRAAPRRPEHQAPVIASVIAAAEAELDLGAVVVIEANRIRIRRLPIGGDAPDA